MQLRKSVNLFQSELFVDCLHWMSKETKTKSKPNNMPHRLFLDISY